jgi:hypothetical protein
MENNDNENDKSFYHYNTEKNNDNSEHYLCPYCHNFPLIICIDKEKIFIKCEEKAEMNLDIYLKKK